MEEICSRMITTRPNGGLASVAVGRLSIVFHNLSDHYSLFCFALNVPKRTHLPLLGGLFPLYGTSWIEMTG
jgi:hypothetical protein